MALYDTTGSSINTGGFTGQTAFGTGQMPLAGRFMGLDKERIKEYKEAFGDEMGALVYLLEQQRANESDPQRIKERLDVLGPYHKDVARENQRLGQESAVFAGILGLPDRAFRAASASHYYMPETMQAISENIRRPIPFVNRQYTRL